MLSNGYYYLEIESKGLILHVKHENNYQSIKEQIVKADYRRELTARNRDLGQMPLFADEKPLPIPKEIYAILFFKDNESKRSEVDNIYFILPSIGEGLTLAYTKIEEVIACSMPKPEAATQSASDKIDLPSKKKTDEDQQAK